MRVGQPLGALGDLLLHVGDVEARHGAGLGHQRGRRLRVVGVEVDLERRAVADHEHGVAERLELSTQLRGVEVLPVTAKFVLGGPLREIATAEEAEFRMLAVDPAAGGRGIGTLLVRECAQRARAAGLVRLVCSTQPRMTAAHALYRRLGFVRDQARDWKPIPEVDLVALVLEL